MNKCLINYGIVLQNRHDFNLQCDPNNFNSLQHRSYSFPWSSNFLPHLLAEKEAYNFRVHQFEAGQIKPQITHFQGSKSR